MPWSSLLLLLVAAPSLLRAGPPVLLGQAVEKWIGERNQWAFTQFVREYDGGEIREERLERFDPSQPGVKRWQLVSVNGQPPSAARRAEWHSRKMRKRLNPGMSLEGFFDFEHATVAEESAERVWFNLPLRNSHSWLFPLDRVNLKVSVDKATRAIDRVEAGIDEPFRVAFGLGRVLDLDFDVRMNPSLRLEEADDPTAARPGGTATAAMNKFGERVEYRWSEFRRVTPHPDNATLAAAKP